MKIKTISYKKIFPIGSFQNETIGVEIQLEDGDDIEAAFQTAKQQVEAWHTPPEPFDEHIPSMTQMQEWDTHGEMGAPLTQSERIIQQIKECSDAKVLSSFELLAKNNPEVKDAYDKRVKELQK